MERYGVKLVVVDNLGVVNGGTDENAIGMSCVMGNWRSIAERFQLAVVLIHHQTKNNQTSRVGNSLRGHSSIEAALDLALRAEREGQSPIVTVKSTKTRGADIHPFSAIFDYEHRRGTTDLYKARFWGVPATLDSKVYAIEQAILNTVNENPGLNKGELTSIVHGQLEGAGKNAIGDVIDELQVAGKLKLEIKKSGSKTYSLAQAEVGADSSPMDFQDPWWGDSE